MLINPIEGVLIYGFGGHARSIADVALANGIKALLFVEKNTVQEEYFAGFSVVKEFSGQLPSGWIAFPAAGEGTKRQEQLDDIKLRGWDTGNIISLTATIGTWAAIGNACFIGHHAHIGPKTVIGTGCIVNTGAIIEHDCSIGNFTHISVNSTVAGKTRIGENCFIAAGATVINNIRIGNNITLGAGGCFIQDTLQPGIYVGLPAKALNEI
ncbi:NeuD/PglB/VioB family sugar acetyltransferase [Salmonella enterica]